VLVPHGRDDAELRQGRLAADEIDEALILVVFQPVLADEVRRDGHVVADHL
jgi:hypothetical protein